MSIDRIELQPNYSISRIIKGGWHLAGGHGHINEAKAISDMKAFVDAGVTTFDCADIYTGVEAMIGKFLKKYKHQFSSGDLAPVQVHTKYVPDYIALQNLTFQDTEKIIDRSLRRLGVDRLDLVQFAWWDYNIPRYVETAHHLKKLQQTGKIRYIGLTNFDGTRVKEIVESGISIVSNQVQYSLIDNRVEKDSNEIMSTYGIKYLCYGVLAGGFLSSRYLGSPDPSPPFENRSLTKYRLIIDEFGGYSFFQQVLRILQEIGNKYNVGIAEIANRYILQKDFVASSIIGARNVNHLQNLLQVFNFHLDAEDLNLIQGILDNAKGPNGPFYELERDKSGKHGSIMKYNLNSE